MNSTSTQPSFSFGNKNPAQTEFSFGASKQTPETSQSKAEAHAPTTKTAFSFGAVPSSAATTLPPTDQPLKGILSESTKNEKKADPLQTPSVTFNLPKTQNIDVPSTPLGAQTPGPLTLSALTKTTDKSKSIASTIDSQNVSIPSIIKNKSLEEISELWKAELESQVKSFHKLANQVSDWDLLLIESGERIMALNDELQQTEAIQCEVEQNLEYISVQQKELASILNYLDEATGKLVDDQDFSKVDLDRDHMLQKAETFQEELDEVSDTLSGLVEEINSSLEYDNPVMDIVKILNLHLDSLRWSDTRMTELEEKINCIKKLQNAFEVDSARLLGK